LFLFTPYALYALKMVGIVLIYPIYYQIINIKNFFATGLTQETLFEFGKNFMILGDSRTPLWNEENSVG
jgi:hypothetical protein